MVKKRLIFIVDDDPFINKLIVNKFTREGFEVRAFESGEGCIDNIGDNPGLIILDYFFTGSSELYPDGMVIFNKIRELKPEIPVIMLSGQESGELVLEFARKGIADYIIKDSNLTDNLSAAVSDVFAREG
ncbi:MAG TPA: response regulator [Bacteroidales bacterium]|jgi:DNA-binding NtrC family response regulator|nr:response regulator [Bacteroidales bacterium]HQH25315.1 response regulator [Bacteroidales bacterium]HQJ82463.1 response regulator [Bacteroidales bacterium]